jgi:hypothetical protein
LVLIGWFLRPTFGPVMETNHQRGKKMEDIRVAIFGGTMTAAFVEKGFRFHVWLGKSGNPEGILFKNPPLETRRGDPGYFQTIRLDATNKTNAPKIKKLMEAVRERDLIAKAHKDYHDALAAKRADERVRAATLYRAALAILVEQMAAKKLEPVSAIGGLHNFLTSASDEQLIELGASMVGAGV